MDIKHIIFRTGEKTFYRAVPIHKKLLNCDSPCGQTLRSKFLIVTNSFTAQSVLWQVHNLFKSKFSYIVRSRASFYKFQHPVSSLRSPFSWLRLLSCLLFPFTFPSIMSFRRHFVRKMSPIQSDFLPFAACIMVLCSLTLCNNTSFLTRSVKLIFSIFLQQHISELSWKFWSIFPSVKVSAPYNAMLQM